jgi:Phage protein (N4 Gp49/phage Sf6 gene 66) family
MNRADGGANITMRHTNIRVDKLPTFCRHCLGILGETCICTPNIGEPKMADDLAISDDEAAAVAKTPYRVTLDDMLSKVEREEYYRPIHAQHVTVAIVTMRNGYVLVGKSAPADPKNYDYELGRKFAKEDCIRQLWSLEGYALRERMHEGGT